MSETLNLTTAEVTPAITTSDYHVIYISFDWERALILIAVRGTHGERREFRYEGDTATTLMVALNKINLSTKSLQRRILERLDSDGLLLGTVSGSPD